MNTDDKQPTRGRERAGESGNKSGAQPAETETAVKGGAEPAKRQAERDWQESAKDRGE